MDKITAAAQLDILAMMLESDGWGKHYLEAVEMGADALRGGMNRTE